MENSNSIYEISNSGALSLKSNVTGKLMFQFDDNEAKQFLDISDYGKVVFELQQNKPICSTLPSLISRNTVCLSFTDGDRIFKLFIEDL